MLIHRTHLGVGLAIVLGGLALAAVQFVPTRVMHGPNVSTSVYAGWSRNPGTFLLAWAWEATYATLGEELFFRGLLGGWLVRRAGFQLGNALQAVVFLLPHLLLLLLSVSTWPILVIQGLAGWVLGWLRFRSDSVLPGWLAHSLVNALGAFTSMRWTKVSTTDEWTWIPRWPSLPTTSAIMRSSTSAVRCV